LLPSFLATSFIFTGLFFHQIHLIESKGWSISIFVGFFIVYATTQIFSALMTGLLVDRYNAKCMMRFYLIPAIIGLSFIVSFDAQWAGAAFMAFFGLSAGAVGVVHGAIWAETYGIAHLGGIKALGTAFMVLSSALSPPIMGMAIDGGVTIEAISLACAAYMVFATALVVIVFPRIK
jgi:MFS family permease